MTERGDITHLLGAASADTEAADELYRRVYRTLRDLARRQLGRGGRRNSDLDTTALVHEAYLKMLPADCADLADRRHFFSLSAMAMRQIIVDHARGQQRDKRGGGIRALSLEETGVGEVPVGGDPESLLALDRALHQLTAADPRLARVVELRFFGGFSVEETAEILDVSTPTVKRDTRLARAFLQRALEEG